MTPDERLAAIEADLPHVHRPDGVWLVERLRDARAEIKRLRHNSDRLADLVAEAKSERDEARAEVERLREEVADQHTLIQRQGDLLTGAVNALRGDPPELTWWSHHDVAERAAGLVAELADKRAKAERVAELADFFQGRLPDGTGNGRAYNSYRVAEFIRAALTGGEQ